MAERHGGVDFFISYTGADRAWAEWIAWQLEAAGHGVVVQAWDFRPGENFVVQMRRALDTAERTLAVVSAAYLESVYGSDEWTAAFIHDRPDTTGLVVVRVEDVSLPRLLRPWIYIDLVDMDAEAAAAALLAGLERGRRKPSQPPTFPPAIQPAGAPRFPGQGLANLPPRNPNFTGRQQLLDTLARNLQAGQVAAVVGQPAGGQGPPADAAAVQALAGMGGVGKSQLALEYAHRHAADYQLRWWIPAEQPLAIPAALAALARELGIDEHADQEETVAQVLAELGRRQRWLLVFDNAVHPKDLAGYQPSGGSGHVLVTTRTRSWGGVATRLKVGVFDKEEAAAFLERRTGSSDREAAEALSGELGGLPLALEQAAAFMEQTGLGLGEYLGLYRRDREVLLDKGEPVAYGATVDATFRLAVGKVAEHSQAAVALVELCAFLAPEVIPHQLLRAKPEVLPAALGQAVSDEVAYVETVGVLHGFSLLERDQAGVRVHRLIQAVTRHRLDPDRRAAWAVLAVELVRAAWPDESWLPAAWPQCGQLLPHALAVAHAEELATAREVPGVLLNEVGLYLEGRAELTAARATFERALAISEVAYGPDHPMVAIILTNLGVVLDELGKLPEARAHHERAVVINEVAYGPDHPEVARTLTNLGSVLRRLGELPQARDRLERALVIEEVAYGPDHPEVAQTVGSLGVVLDELGELSAARFRLEQALAIQEGVYGPDHPHVATTLDNLGVVHNELGELPQARACHERALAIREVAYGPDHPEVAISLTNLGSVLRQLGELPQARDRHERALASFETAYGPDHPYVVTSLGNLGSVLRQLGELAKAEACEQRAKAIRQRLNPRD